MRGARIASCAAVVVLRCRCVCSTTVCAMKVWAAVVPDDGLSVDSAVAGPLNDNIGTFDIRIRLRIPERVLKGIAKMVGV